jgi:hypothetical protein
MHCARLASSFGLLLFAALCVDCDGTVAPRNDDASARATLDAVVGTIPDVTIDSRVTSEAGVCSALALRADTGGACTLCENHWYCPGNQVYVACPQGNTGPDDGSSLCDFPQPCFTCDLDGESGSVCACGPSEDGGTNESGTNVWTCVGSETSCSN